MRLLKGPRLPVTNNCLLGTCSLSLAVLRGIDEDCISESSQEVCSRSGKRPNGRRDKGRTGLGLRKQPRRYCLQRRSGTWCVARTEVARWPRHPYSHTESEFQERQGSWRFGMPQSEVIGEKTRKEVTLQDRYVGDIGDFVKFALLRAVFKGAKLGVAWYLHPDECASNDGRHTDYLKRSCEWRCFDKDLFDGLNEIVKTGSRSVAAVQASSVLPKAVFASQPLNIGSMAPGSRESWRSAWFDSVCKRLENCCVVFADPDNGLVLDTNFQPTWKRSAKSIPMQEIERLSEGRPMVVYHHNTRFKGGHKAEIAKWQDELPGRVYAYYFRRWSNRTFFFMNSDCRTVDRLEGFAELWSRHGELIKPRP